MVNGYKLISSCDERKGNNLNVKFNKTGKKMIQEIVVGKEKDKTYSIKLAVNHKDLVNDIIHKVDYKLINEVKIYNNKLNNFYLIENLMDCDEDKANEDLNNE